MPPIGLNIDFIDLFITLKEGPTLPADATLATAKEATPPVEPTTKECPFCFYTIPIKAVKCPYCTSGL